MKHLLTHSLAPWQPRPAPKKDEIRESCLCAFAIHLIRSCFPGILFQPRPAPRARGLCERRGAASDLSPPSPEPAWAVQVPVSSSVNSFWGEPPQVPVICFVSSKNTAIIQVAPLYENSGKANEPAGSAFPAVVPKTCLISGWVNS